MNKIKEEHPLSNAFQNMIFELKPIDTTFNGSVTIIAPSLEEANILLSSYKEERGNGCGLPLEVSERNYTYYKTDENIGVLNGIFPVENIDLFTKEETVLNP